MKKNKIICVIDPTFFVSWSRFRYGSKLAEAVERGYITEEFYNLFSESTTLSFLRSLLESKVIVIYEFFEESRNDVLSAIMRTFIEDDKLCQPDKVLAKLLTIAIMEDIPILSDNYCIHKFARLYWDHSMVWSSYKMINYMTKLGLFDDPKKVLEAFSQDTKTIFIKLQRNFL